MDDRVERRRHLLADGTHREVVTGHQHHRLDAGQSVPRAVGVDGRERAVMARIHGLQHVERFGAANLADDDPVGPHAQRVAHELADRHAVLAGQVHRARLEPKDMPLIEPELGGVLDRHDPLSVGDRRRQRVQQGGLSRAGSARDQHVQLGANASLDKLDGLLTQGAQLDHVVEREPLPAELADSHERAGEGQRRYDRVDTTAVGQAGVDHRRRLVDATADLGDHLVDDPPEMPLVVEVHSRLLEPALTLHPDVVRAVDHDLGDAVVGEQPFERTVTENVVGDLQRDARSIVPGDTGLLRKLVANVREDTLPQVLGIHVDVVELRSQVADDREVDPALQLCEGITLGRRTARPRGIQALVQLHYRRLLASSDFLSPALAAAGTAGPLTGAFA